MAGLESASLTDCATTGPTPFVSSICAPSDPRKSSRSVRNRSQRASREPTKGATSSAVSLPTCLIPRPNRKRASDVCRRVRSMASHNFRARISPIPWPSIASKSGSVKWYRSAALVIKPDAIKRSIQLPPRPAMSTADRPAKCRTRAERCAGHDAFEHRATASSPSRAIGPSHAGQAVGNAHSVSCPSRREPSRSTPRIAGITPPARCTRTQSPIRRSSARTWSSLCNVALETVTPPSLTGSRTAKGVTAPVLPI